MTNLSKECLAGSTGYVLKYEPGTFSYDSVALERNSQRWPMSYFSGEKMRKKARPESLFRFKDHWLADKPEHRGPHRVREREQMQVIEEARSDKKDT